MKIDRAHCSGYSNLMGEDNDCVVVALAVATDTDYQSMHKYVAETCDRKVGQRTNNRKWKEAIRDLGYKLTLLGGPLFDWKHYWVDGFEKFDYRSGRYVWVEGHWRRKRVKVRDGINYNALTVRTLARELTEGTYLVQTSGHLLCLRDGVVEDWTRNRTHRVRNVWEVKEGG